VHECFPPDVASQFAANNARVFAARTTQEFEECAPDASGSIRTYLSVKTPLFDEAGHPSALCGVSTDITPLKTLADALQAAHREKDSFIATVAHELRQPLAAIQTALALTRKAVAPERLDHARAVAERQTAHVSRLVDDLLDASRIAQGKIVLHRQRGVLNGILDAALSVVQPLIEERRQELRVEMPETPIWMDADVARLQQVFSNLLMNASKFTDVGGRILVRVDVAAAAVTVRVRDTGRGIEAAVLPHIFEAFTQASPDGRGLGIGLAVVRALVQQHGGSVEARSDGPGRGSEFIVSLPVASASV
jgi:signal transduction histidine kinase